MKTYIKIFIASLLTLTISSCEFLDKQPHELTPETYFNSESELQSFLAGVYSPLGQEYFYGNYYPVYNAGGDDLSFYQRANSPVSIMTADANSTNQYISAYWRLLYDGISRANILIENVDKNETISEAIRNRVKSEAVFLRAFYYFNLIQGWGDVPFRLTSAQSVDNLSLPRTDKQIIYDSITNQIVKSIPYLNSAANTNPGYVTQSAAKGILARIYMFRAGEHFRDNKTADNHVQKYFQEAKKWALEVKESGIHELTKSYSQVFTDLCQDKYNSTGKKESIWEAEEAGNRINSPDWSAGRIGNVIGFGSTNDYSTVSPYQNQGGMSNPGYSYKFVYASLKLFNMYESENDTARCDWNITPYEYVYASTAPKQVTGRNYYFGKRRAGLATVEGLPCTDMTQSASNNNKTRCCAKYRRELETVLIKNKNYTPINFPILRYSDVLLMIAEAENEINSAPTQLAYDCINEVRRRAHIVEYQVGSLEQTTFRDAVKKERAMELCFEGIRRWDLIRWGDFYKNMQSMRSSVNDPGWGSGFKYAASYYNVSENYNYYPIPSIELSVNKEITSNNPGW
ncbi:MAG TPA: RagB/SusD family nutrient uptake outer membrane protein [Paludibacteraceae bacterium]|nr:RagB/SusD family nutrient uptake outer membrane protein [Paludibacteraceae bacterium]HPT43163.1 RagB/SusD family nutrient uptake outer membrane protein [Paludibacteraceae bacterium]